MEKVTEVERKGVSELTGARYTAVRLLSRYERSDSYVDKLLNHEMNHSNLSHQDKALLNELVIGVIRWKNKLDWTLTGFYHGEFQKCLNIVKNAMRVGLYQILFLNKIPVHAAINESVEIVKRIQGEKTAGIVNAVLRNISRNQDNIRYPNPNQDLVYYFSIIHSHPKWMIKRWIDFFGEKFTEELVDANNRRPGVTLRVNTMQSSKDKILSIFNEKDVKYSISPYLDTSISIYSTHNNIAQTELFRSGEITVQDTSATFAAILTGAKPGDSVVDLCAAPGGKSHMIGEMMKNLGKVLAVDKYHSKLQFIKEGADRLGLTIVEPVRGDATNIKFDKDIDVVLADVPCSGLGTLSKKPDIKWKRDQDDIPALQLTQREILANATKIVKTGGTFVYSTCTIEPEENSDNMKWFLENNPEFELEPAEKFIPAELCKDGFMQTFPHLHNMDGAFAARLKKVGKSE